MGGRKGGGCKFWERGRGREAGAARTPTFCPSSFNGTNASFDALMTANPFRNLSSFTFRLLLFNRNVFVAIVVVAVVAVFVAVVAVFVAVVVVFVAVVAVFVLTAFDVPPVVRPVGPVALVGGLFSLGSFTMGSNLTFFLLFFAWSGRVAVVGLVALDVDGACLTDTAGFVGGLLLPLTSFAAAFCLPRWIFKLVDRVR
jgi:hypothetical protein